MHILLLLIYLVVVLSFYISGYIYKFKQEDIDGVQDLRFYVESDGKKYYMMVQPNGDIATLPAEDLVPGSTIDTQCRYRLVV